MADLWQLSGSELAALIARKQVVELHLRRIEAVNPKVNAIVRVLADQARKDAAEADRKIAAGDLLGPLHGVPFTIKENIDFAGTATTWGVKALANAVAPSDAPVVEQMRAASAIPIGRTNLPDMARPHRQFPARADSKSIIRPVVLANLLGLPSACVPAGRDSVTGLPVGVVIPGRRLRDDKCLDAAEAIETRLGIELRSIRSDPNRLHEAIGETPNSQRCRPASSAIHKMTPSAIAPIVAPQFGAG